LIKNVEGQRARKLAAGGAHRATAKVCRRAEKVQAASVSQLSAVKLYDFCNERRHLLLERLETLDTENTGLVNSAEFLQVISVETVLPCILYICHRPMYKMATDQ